MFQLSIIIPIYNTEKYLRECIDSILASTFLDYELLLIDDGSTDSSGSICDEYKKKDSRVKVVHKQNGGPSSARNVGIDEARGEWVTFIDADDLVSPSFLQNLCKVYVDNPQVEFVQAGCTNFRNNHPTTVEQEYHNIVSTDKGLLFSSFRGLCVSKLFKKQILDSFNVRYDEWIRSAEDLQFTLDYIYYVSCYAFSSEIGYYYRRDNSSSLTNSYEHHPYEICLYTFKKRYQSVHSFLEKNKLHQAYTLMRYQQLASLLSFAIYQLYRSYPDSTTKISNLKTNYSKEELSVGKYCKGRVNRFLFGSLLAHQYYWMFDKTISFYLNYGTLIRSLVRRG